jgi:hypothetical protein
MENAVGMDQRRLGRLGLLLAATGVALVLAGRLGAHPSDATPVALGGKRKAVLAAGLVLTLAATAVIPLAPRLDLLRRVRLPRRLALAAVAGALLLLAWALLTALDQSLWHDEAYTVLQYASRGPSEILYGDYVPNDHVLFNLLAWATTGVAGESEVAFRFWSVVPALAAVGLAVWWAWTRLGPATAVALALLAATSPLILVLARQARGYGLALLAGALMLVSADRFARERRGHDLAGFGLAGFVGAATLPVFALAFVGQALPLMTRRSARLRVAAVVGAVGVALLVLYAGLLGDLFESTGQEFGRKLPWHGPLTTAATDLLGPNVQFVFTSHLPPPRPDASVAADSAIAAAVAAAGAALLWRSGERMLCALLIAPLLLSYTALTIARVFVEPRFVSFLVLHTLVLAACGVIGLIALMPARWASAALAAGATVAAAFAVLHTVRAADQLHDLPSENFKEAAAVARREGASQVLTDSPRPQGLQYYLGTDNVVQLPADQLQELFCTSRKPLVYVNQPFRGAGEPPPADVSCLRRRHARMVRVRQRERGGHLDVWALTPR